MFFIPYIQILGIINKTEIKTITMSKLMYDSEKLNIWGTHRLPLHYKRIAL